MCSRCSSLEAQNEGHVQKQLDKTINNQSSGANVRIQHNLQILDISGLDAARRNQALLSKHRSLLRSRHRPSGKQLSTHMACNPFPTASARRHAAPSAATAALAKAGSGRAGPSRRLRCQCA